MGQRAVKRATDKIKASSSRVLFNFVVDYVVATEDKSRAEKKEAYNLFDNRWRTYVRHENSLKGKSVTLNLEGFKNMTRKRKHMKSLQEKLWKKKPHPLLRLWTKLFSYNKMVKEV